MSTPDPRTPYQIARQLLVDEIREHGHALTGSYVGRPALVLTTTGARSGEARSSPLAYSIDDGRLVVTGSKGGAPEHPAWFHNLIARPEATVDVDRRTTRVRASVAEGDERERLWAQHVAIHPAIGEYPARTTRVIPVVILTPIE